MSAKSMRLLPLQSKAGTGPSSGTRSPDRKEHTTSLQSARPAPLRSAPPRSGRLPGSRVEDEWQGRDHAPLRRRSLSHARSSALTVTARREAECSGIVHDSSAFAARARL
jgi:hypothetical protein